MGGWKKQTQNDSKQKKTFIFLIYTITFQTHRTEAKANKFLIHKGQNKGKCFLMKLSESIFFTWWPSGVTPIQDGRH